LDLFDFTSYSEGSIKARCKGSGLLLPATQEPEIRRILVQGKPREKVTETPISTYILDVTVPCCLERGGVGRRTAAHVDPRQKLETLSKKTKKKQKKDWGYA
jgi:hypothetical protein